MPSNQERKQKLSRKLIDYLAERGISGNKLGERLDVSQTSAQAYIDGRTFPGPEIRERIAKLFEVSLEELDAELDGRELSRRLSIADLSREVRLLSRSEFVEFVPTVLSRIQSELESLVS